VKWTGPLVIVMLITACGRDTSGDGNADSLEAAAASMADTASAIALRDSATATLATLLDTPATATFDSVVVMQPPRDGARTPPMAVCGRIGGAPGIKGSASPARFVYQSKWALYVEDAENREQFAQVWANLCVVSGGTVVVRG
jgi:hypothetical protein